MGSEGIELLLGREGRMHLSVDTGEEVQASVQVPVREGHASHQQELTQPSSREQHTDANTSESRPPRGACPGREEPGSARRTEELALRNGRTLAG